jgi:hypothetical protein
MRTALGHHGRDAVFKGERHSWLGDHVADLEVALAAPDPPGSDLIDEPDRRHMRRAVRPYRAQPGVTFPVEPCDDNLSEIMSHRDILQPLDPMK